MEMNITFPGGKRVNAELEGVVIATDQPVAAGGEGAAPSPFVLFLASLGTCAGIYVLSFCQQRQIPTEHIRLSQRMEFAAAPDGKQRLAGVAIDIKVPADFPEKYRNALVKSAELCAVKKVLMDPPEFTIRTVID